MRELLKTTAGVILHGRRDRRGRTSASRGFSARQAGDIYVDGLRDAPLIERDTFNHESVRVLGDRHPCCSWQNRPAAWSTRSARSRSDDQHEVDVTVGRVNELRVTATSTPGQARDLALRINAMSHEAGKPRRQYRQEGYRSAELPLGHCTRDAFCRALPSGTDGKPFYNHPLVPERGSQGEDWSPSLPAGNYYGLASDYLRTRQHGCQPRTASTAAASQDHAAHRPRAR